MLNYKEYKELMLSVMESNNNNKISVNNPELVYYSCIELVKEKQECFVILTLDVKCRIINKHLISKGTVHKTIVYPRDIFRRAIEDNAVSIILVHNHPSGSTEPSQEDINMTENIEHGGKILGINIHDHIIVAGDSYLSLREKGLM